MPLTKILLWQIFPNYGINARIIRNSKINYNSAVLCHELFTVNRVKIELQIQYSAKGRWLGLAYYTFEISYCTI